MLYDEITVTLAIALLVFAAITKFVYCLNRGILTQLPEDQYLGAPNAGKNFARIQFLQISRSLLRCLLLTR